MCFFHLTTLTTSLISVCFPSLASLTTLSMFCSLNTLHHYMICISPWQLRTLSISFPEHITSILLLNPCAEPLLHSLKMFDRFLPNGWTQWNYSRALNSHRSSQPYFSRFLYPRHSAKTQGGDMTVGGRRQHLYSRNLGAVPHVYTHTHTHILTHLNILCFVTLDEENYIVILDKRENKLLRQFPVGKKNTCTLCLLESK